MHDEDRPRNVEENIYALRKENYAVKLILQSLLIHFVSDEGNAASRQRAALDIKEVAIASLDKSKFMGGDKDEENTWKKDISSVIDSFFDRITFKDL